jgi:hypothetical protein
MSTMSLQDDLVASFSWVDGHANIWPCFANADLFAAIVEDSLVPSKGTGSRGLSATRREPSFWPALLRDG